MIIKTFARKFAFPLIVKSGVSNLISKLYSKDHIVLNYHGVVKNLNLAVSVNHMDTDNFEAQIKYFSRHFNILHQDEFIASIEMKKKQKRKNILITFDDGYENNYTNALPILKRYNAPATIFPVVNLINSKNPTWYDFLDTNKAIINSTSGFENLNIKMRELGHNDLISKNFGDFKNKFKTLNTDQKSSLTKIVKDVFSIGEINSNEAEEYWKILNTDQINELAKGDFITFGSHTLNHPNLDLLSQNDLIDELSISKTKLSEIVNNKIDSIAFPDGAYNENVKTACYELGYKTLFSVNSRCNSDTHDKRIFQRVSISNTTTSESSILNVIKSLSKLGY